MKSMGEKFIVQAQAGWIDVELEDGTTQRIHRAEHFKCEDGTLKTVEEALEYGAKLPINAVRVTASHPGAIRDESEGDLDRIRKEWCLPVQQITLCCLLLNQLSIYVVENSLSRRVFRCCSHYSWRR